MRCIAALVLLLNACGGGSPPASEQASLGPGTRAWMQAHFQEGVAVRNAVVQDNLEEARGRFQHLAAQPGPRDAPAAWSAHLTALQAAARGGARASTMDEAAAAVGSMAIVCGDCHRSVGADVTLPATEPPGEDEPPAQMQRHIWAAERMWEGLVAPAPARYAEGASVLAQAPMHPAELRVGASPPLEVVALAERARSLAGDASRADTTLERGRLYGQLLSTCASCHGQQPAGE
jgi:cytochrome c553